jgi:hypothetical protein
VINLQTINSNFTFEYSSGGSPEYSGIIEFQNVKIIAFTADGSAEFSSAAVSPLTSDSRIRAVAAVCLCTDLSLYIYM